jgi:hypothetical protein
MPADGWECELSIPNATDNDLGEAIYNMALQEANWITEGRCCFVEAGLTAAVGPDRGW